MTIMCGVSSCKGCGATGVQPAVAPKLRRIVSFLQDMEREEELRAVPGWTAHKLTSEDYH